MKKRILCLTLAFSLILSGSMNVEKTKAAKLSKTSIFMSKGKTTRIKLKNTKKKVKYKSSNKKIATVTSTGLIRGVKKGKCKITASVGKKKYKCNVTVETPYRSTSKVALKVDKTKMVSIKGTEREAKFSSEDKSIAKVNSDGIITGVSVGKTTIIAKLSDKKFKIPVTVVPNISNIDDTNNQNTNNNQNNNNNNQTSENPNNSINNPLDTPPPTQTQEPSKENYLKKISTEQLPTTSEEYNYFAITNENNMSLMVSGNYIDEKNTTLDSFYLSKNNKTILKTPKNVSGINITNAVSNGKYTDITDSIKIIKSGREEIANAYESNYINLRNISEEFNISELGFIELIKDSSGNIVESNEYKIENKSCNIEFKYLTSNEDYTEMGYELSYNINYAYSNHTRFFEVSAEGEGTSAYDGAVSFDTNIGARASDLRYFQIYSYYNDTNSDVCIHAYVNPYVRTTSGTTYYGMNVATKYNEDWDKNFNWNQFKNYWETKSYIKQGNTGYILVPKSEYYYSIYGTDAIRCDVKFIGESLDSVSNLSASGFLNANTSKLEIGETLEFEIEKTNALKGKEVTATVFIPLLSQDNRLLTIISDNIIIPADVSTYKYSTPFYLELNDQSDYSQEYINSSYLDSVFFSNVTAK